jgi:hypothetical protein
MLSGVVLQAFMRQPLTLPNGEELFVVELREPDGIEHRLVSRVRPEVFGPDSLPMTLAAEIGPGSHLKVDVDGRVVRAVQVLVDII